MAVNCTEFAVQQNITETECLQQQIRALYALRTQDARDMDIGWTLTSAWLIFFMKTGFAMLESGGVRVVNVMSILLKNLMDTSIGSIAWYLFGYAFAFGDTEPGSYVGNPFIGTHYFATSGLTSATSPYDFRHWIFQWAFAITSSTIVSGAMAERTRLRAYFIFCIGLSAWIYPVATHWIWSKDGWLSPYKAVPMYANGFLDFAGDSVVHMIGGVSAFVGAAIVGPRIGRFDPQLKEHFEPHNQSFMMLGTMILWFGWYGFNPGSTQALANGQALVAARISINTTLAAACGTIAGLFCAKMFMKKWHLPTALNGCLAGLVAITGGCAVLQPWAACITGITAALVYYWSSWILVNKLKIDDPLEATNVHLFGGAWGLLMVGLFAYPDLIEQSYAKPAGSVVDYGLFIGGGGKQFAMQILGLVVVGLWAAFWAAALWGGMRLLKMIRISEAAEKNLLSHAVELDQIQQGSRAHKNPGALAKVEAGTEGRQISPNYAAPARDKGNETVIMIHESESSDDDTTPARSGAVAAAASTSASHPARGTSNNNIQYIADKSSSSSSSEDSESSEARRRFTAKARKDSSGLVSKRSKRDHHGNRDPSRNKATKQSSKPTTATTQVKVTNGPPVVNIPDSSDETADE